MLPPHRVGYHCAHDIRRCSSPFCQSAEDDSDYDDSEDESLATESDGEGEVEEDSEDEGLSWDELEERAKKGKAKKGEQLRTAAISGKRTITKCALWRNVQCTLKVWRAEVPLEHAHLNIFPGLHFSQMTRSDLPTKAMRTMKDITRGRRRKKISSSPLCRKHFV
ncbi:transcriptional regulator [Plasmodium ovale wallikeri]|uniref:Transcriptional regulator n=1 Tax=Plasmodium ovale wallikeri TaxID=864142 RepID=A0A1A8YYJ0_PLAOA|nr:transcriptional regulator [Plasmodium ovale wallikeri]SBT36673.1 transcriptional regulator [Plasmodium ovale wallikeri]